MPGLNDKVAHEYDSKYAFRNYNSNAPLLKSWIEDLIRLTDKSLPSGSIPTTETLVQALQRYDVLFKELLRQNNIYSENLSKMFAEVWTGVLNLMMFTIKSYHRYVKHTSHLQSQAQALLTERQRGEAAKKVQKEEFELERTALRACIRNYESELESAHLAKKVMDHENEKLRKIISTYIQSSEFNQRIWDIMKDDDFSSASKAESNGSFANGSFKGKKSLLDKSGQEEAGTPNPQQEFGFRRKDIVDSGKKNLKILNRLDVELNEILSSVLKEKNRQRLLVKDLMRLINKNRDLFTAPDEDTSHGVLARNASVKMRRSSKINLGGLQKGGMGEGEGVEKAIQTDQKDENGSVIERPGDSISVDILTLGVAPLAPATAIKYGTEVPYLLRRCMTSFPKVLRIPPAVWTYQTIMSIYFDKIQDDEEKTKKGEKRMTMSEYVHHYFLKTMGLSAAADTQISLLLCACESHGRKQPRITIFSSQIGLVNKEEPPPMDIRDTDFLLSIVKNLQEQGELVSDSQKASKSKSLANTTVYIKPDISRNAALSTIHSLFEKWLPDGGEDYLIKVRSMQHSEQGQRYIDVDAFIETLIEPWNTVRSNWEEHARYLFKQHSTVYRILQEAQFANDEGRVASDAILVEIQRSNAADCGRRPIRLFQKNDTGNVDDNDEPNPSSTSDNKISKNNNATSSNPNKESVAECMDRRKFVEVVRIIHPTIPIKEIEDMFEEALDIAHASVLRSLEHLWSRYIDEASNYFVTPLAGGGGNSLSAGTLLLDDQDEKHDKITRGATHRHLGTNREFWVNNITTLSQWSRPYWPHIFRCQDLEMDVFVQILIQKDVFARSPFLEILNITPKDLWPNADMFYRQIKERQKKEKTDPVIPQKLTRTNTNTNANAKNRSRRQQPQLADDERSVESRMSDRSLNSYT